MNFLVCNMVEDELTTALAGVGEKRLSDKNDRGRSPLYVEKDSARIDSTCAGSLCSGRKPYAGPKHSG
jgi:hypothetical protein